MGPQWLLHCTNGPKYSSSLVTRPKTVLDSGKCFVVWEVFLDSGKCFVVWEVFWILGSVFGFWEVFCPYGPPYCRGRQSFAVVGAAKLAPISGGNIRRIGTFWQWVITLSTQSAVTDLRSMKKLEYASGTLFWLALSKEGVWNQMLTPTFSRYSIKGLLARRNGRMGGMRSCASWKHSKYHFPQPHPSKPSPPSLFLGR